VNLSNAGIGGNLANICNGAAAVFTSGEYISLDLTTCVTGNGSIYGVPDEYYSSSPYILPATRARIVAISLPAAVTKLIKGGAYGAFEGFTKLKSISAPGVTTVSDQAFEGCTALTTVNFPLATFIYDSAFVGCTALTTVSLPKATFIQAWAFGSCTALTSLTLGNSVPAVQGNVFYGVPSTLTIHVPSATLAPGAVWDVAKGESPWNRYTVVGY
jgi:hypothetical protein